MLAEQGVVPVGLGTSLQEARLRQDLTLENAERATKVRRVFLEALEAERYDLLPAKVFTQGFVRVYARYLGLDPRPLLLLLPPDAVPPFLPPRRTSVSPASLRSWLVALAGMLVGPLVGLYLSQETTTPIRSVEPLVVALQVTATPSHQTAASLSGSLSVPTASPASPTPTAVPPTATPTPIPFISVSSVRGMALSQAVQALQGLGLKVVTEERWISDLAKGMVAAQQPAPGERLQSGATVTVVVSKGPEGLSVPNMTGRREAEARKLLSEAGLLPSRYANYQGRADLSEDVLSQVCIGCVLSAAPHPGEQVPPGTEVFLAVRKE